MAVTARAAPRRHARTVDAWVDRAIAPLVDALNDSTLGVRTRFCCSGHASRCDWPYLSFDADDMSSVAFLTACVVSLNAVTHGQSRIELGLRKGSGIVRLSVYPAIWDDVDLWPMTSGLAHPPKRLVELWWLELAELTRMVRRHDERASAAFARSFARTRAARTKRPWWHAVYPLQYEPAPDALPRLIAEVQRRETAR